MRRALLLLPLILAACQIDHAGTQPALAPTTGTGKPYTRATDHSSPAGKLYEAGKFRDALAPAQAELAAAIRTGDRSAKLQAMGLLGDVQSRLAHFKDADKAYGDALAMLDEKKDADQLPLAKCYNDLAELRYLTADWKPALDFANKSLAIRKKLLPADHPDLADSLSAVGFLLTADPAEPTSERIVAAAHTNLVEAWKIREKVLGPDAPDTADSLNSLGLFFLDNEIDDEDVFPDSADEDTRVQRCLNTALDIRTRLLPKGHADIAESLINIASFNFSRQHLDDAIANAEEGLHILEAAYGPDHPDVAYTLNIIGEIRQQQGRLLEAEALFQRAQRIYESTFGPNHYYVGMVLSNLADLYSDIGDKNKVKMIEKRLDRIRGRDI